MITILFPQMEHPVSISAITTLYIQSPAIFSSLLIFINSNLLGTTDSSELKVFDEKGRQIGLSTMLFVNDVITFDFKSRSITAAIQKRLQKRVAQDPELWESLRIQLEKLDTSVEDLLLGDELDLQMDSEWEISKICKTYDITLKTNDNESFLERAERIIEISNQLGIARIIILKNLQQFLSLAEREQLFLCALNNGVFLLVIESGDVQQVTDLEKVITLDSDFNQELIVSKTKKTDETLKFDFVEVLE